MFSIEWKMTIPNALSLFRIALVPVFAVLYLYSGPDNHLLYWAVGVLVLSGLTDSFDGIIARKFNQITDLGQAARSGLPTKPHPGDGGALSGDPPIPI